MSFIRPAASVEHLPPIAHALSTMLIIGTGEGQRYEVQDGMTIGSGERCDVRIAVPDVCEVHANIVRSSADGLLHAMIAQNGFAFTLPNGADATNVTLLPGTRFNIGSVELRCPGSINVRIACPRCRSMLITLPADARFCARCGLELPAFCPPWDPAEHDRLAPAAHHHPMFFAYLNALFNLGMRYESHERDGEQAHRYFEKAAKLGSVAAQVRLESTASTSS